MKLNKTILLFSAAALMLSFSSCYELNRFPEDKLSSGTFFKTQAHADQALMGVYSVMRNENAMGLTFSMDCLGGLGTGYDPASYQNMMRGTYGVTDGQVKNKWIQLYEGITRSNIVLQNIDGVDMSEELKQQYRAEARFMRALYYNSLLTFFGGVPIYDESFVVAEGFNEMLNPRSTEEEVRGFILADLDVAIASLPTEWDTTNYGRATSGAATALKGKVFLYAKQYGEAARCFETVVNSGKYELYSNYANLFKPDGDQSNEMIFAVQNMGGVGTDFGMPMCFYMGTRASFGSCWNNVMASVDFVDSYEWKDGRPFDWEEIAPGFTTDNGVKEETFGAVLATGGGAVVSYPLAKEKLLNMYINRDPRMNHTVILPYTWYKGWFKNAPHDCEYVITKPGTPTPTDGYNMMRVNGSHYYYQWRKFVPEYDLGGELNNRAHTPINFPLIRYADVLLMLAECYNEAGNTAGAVEYINQVRSRSGVEMPALNSGPSWLSATTKEEVFKRIKHERAVELAGEGHSFNDMRRWGLLETLNNKPEKYVTGRTHFTRVVTERDYLWPIPADEVFQNTALIQNPGW
ncbi:MAG: RagB/SusD family nutrient uptake outer membrane protein [Phocaeicola sp.]